ncbi:MAG: hypothetical protein NW241_15510 [Bacteroidia bacterium]|nr:hypothetical protein [Bacteroidia bacterium]
MEFSILMWNRLEGTSRNENQIENALRFEVRDPLWMLTRQWQFGEFDGEDAGTAAFARIETAHEPVAFSGRAGAPPQPFDIRNTPFEMAVEFEQPEPDLTIRMEMGRHWRRLLKKHLAAEKAADVWRQFLRNRRFHFNKPVDGDAVYRFRHAQALSDERLLQSLELLQGGRALDGYTLYRELKAGVRASLFLPALDGEVDALGETFVAWYENTYGQDHSSANTWHAQHLEYQPQLAFRKEDGTAQVLKKEEYFGDGIGWHGFSAGGGWDERHNLTLPEGGGGEAAMVIPTPVRFRGMPSTRLWEMEDAQVDFGSIRAASTELSKMLYAEFGLVYGNDWLLAPVRLPVGDLCRLAGLRVTDIFGKTSILQEIKSDGNWSFMQRPVPGSNSANWLFTAPGPETVQESRPIEKVVFMRDEMANLVWAVEEITADPLGGGRDGAQLARLLEQWLKGLIPVVEDAPQEGATTPAWTYTAGRHVAENRIPFVPVAMQADPDQAFGMRQVVLQRAALPRILEDIPPVRVRPRTTLLGAGGGDEPERLPPFFIFEEEIPRAGATLQLLWKRTRWFDGATRVWAAKKKSVGRGETDVLFRFDTLENPRG